MTGTRRKTAAGKTGRKPTRKKAAPKKASHTAKKAAPKKAAPKKVAPRKKPAAKKAKPARKAAVKKAAVRKSVTKKVAVGKAVTGVKMRSGGNPKQNETVSPRPTARRIHAALIGGIAPYRHVRGETYMNEAQRRHFAQLLDTWKQELMEEVDRTVHHMRDEASNFPDPNDRASQESEFSLELRTRDRERKLLRKINQGIKRLETNEYGWCEACGAEIGIRRLEARPTATLCIDCKTLDEIRERQIGG